MSQLTINGHFEGTAVVLDEPATLAAGQRVRVVVVVAEAGAAADPTPPPTPPPPARRSLVGFAKGMFEMRDDFNDELDAFAEYR